jgi:uncharacterized membrane protein YqjE
MSEHGPSSSAMRRASQTADPSTGELVNKLSELSAQLVRSELQLAQTELQQKAKRVGMGAGLFGTAGVVALFGFGALVTTAILALDLALPAWLAALIVAVLLFAVAGVAALVGKKQVSEATPLKPEQAIDGVKQDVETVKEARR